MWPEVCFVNTEIAYKCQRQGRFRVNVYEVCRSGPLLLVVVYLTVCNYRS